MRLEGKRTLITGGARGIGRGISERFLQEGAKVIIVDNRREELKNTVECLRESYNFIEGFFCDLADSSQIEAMADESWKHFNGLDILINNAGIAAREPFIDIALDQWDKIMNVNLRAMFYLSQIIVKKMIEHQRGGAIVNMSSKNGLAGSLKLAHYNSSKGGVISLTESMAVELASQGIRVNAVAPGFIDTPLDQSLKNKEVLELTEHTPIKRLGNIDEVANAFLFLASDEASYITGTTLVVDGGHLANAGEF